MIGALQLDIVYVTELLWTVGILVPFETKGFLIESEKGTVRDFVKILLEVGLGGGEEVVVELVSGFLVLEGSGFSTFGSFFQRVSVSARVEHELGSGVDSLKRWAAEVFVSTVVVPLVGREVFSETWGKSSVVLFFILRFTLG